MGNGGGQVITSVLSGKLFRHCGSVENWRLGCSATQLFVELVDIDV